MPMATSPYVPALKWKQGEHFAAKPLTSAQKTRVLPIAETPDRPYDWGKSKYSKSWDKHIDDLVDATGTNWGTAHDIAVDQVIDDNDSLASNPCTPWEYLFSQMWAAGVRAVPVLSTRASATEQAALVAVSKANKKNRWLLRHRSDPHGDVPAPAHAANWFANALTVIGAKHGTVDAVLDLGYITGDPKVLVSSVTQSLAAVAALGPWRNLVLLSGSFPVNLAGVQKGTKQIPRSEWELFTRVSARAEMKDTPLVFGDYGVMNVDTFDNDPRKMVMSANLRYTHWQEWHVLKGKNVRDYGYDQYKNLCRLLVALPVYMQRTFSQGDANYDQVANNSKVGPGNATQWRRDATNHHIHVVLHQLAGLKEF